ncbi:carbohydrate-binding family 9-like protein [Pyxidicoccus parkwayensis]|uniref:Carbohydrate-binding family 9-like protein n=1 Tax=Pyxidicoccus parkwayensis TaxID=2813578 RepID=A0ABX7PBS3_9BACT|nr:carbohydrate-binding family 9-like protein [Pyxidicoccus parkwaysis]QSQ27838.1 carbohydrate-binding family 9-like protein [Pyxidicoccus parkwaysis]
MRLSSKVLVPLLTLTCLAACRDEQAGPKQRTPRLPAPAQARTLDAAPADLTFRSGATFAGGTVVYLGSKVTPANAAPGEQVHLAHYFQATRPPPQGFGFFVHIIDAASGGMLVNADHEVQGGAAPLASWPVGKVIEDVHSVPMPPVPARVVLGFWRDDQRLPVDDPSAQDGSQRMLGPQLGGNAPDLPEYAVGRVKKAPTIDGVLNDAAWKDARPVVLVGSFDGRPARLRTEARLVYDDANLYVAFDIEDPDIWGTMRNRDDSIYEEEVVEIFLDANADGRTYNELQVSPHNVIFDAYFPARRQGMDRSWDSGMKTAVKVRGTLDNPSDKDEGWTVEMQIPFAHLAEVPHIPPQKGDRWRFNLYRLEHHQRRDVEGQAFSPLFIGDFHALPRFAWLSFQ